MPVCCNRIVAGDSCVVASLAGILFKFLAKNNCRVAQTGIQVISSETKRNLRC